MTREELGEVFRRAREARGMSVDDISNKLRFLKRVIYALESGDYSSIGHTSYAKGFLRTYATELQIPLEDYQDVLNTFPRQDSLSSLKQEQQSSILLKTPNYRRMFGIVATALFALLFCGILWKFGAKFLPDISIPEKPIAPIQTKDPHAEVEKLTQTNRLEDNAVRPPSELPEVKVTPQPEKQPLEAVVTSESAWSSLQGNATIAGAAGLATQEQPATESINPDNPNIPPVPATESALPPKAHQVVVEIVGRSPCWVQGKGDNGEAQSQTLKGGETVTYSFDTEFDLRLGHTKGVRIFYDNEELPNNRKRHIKFPLAR